MKKWWLLVLFFCVPAYAQDTRTEEIAQQKAEKAKHLHPYVPSKAEVVITRISAPRRGLYPYFGSAFSGGGFAAGPGYLWRVGDNASLDIHGAWSVENYRMAQTLVRVPHLAAGRVFMDLEAKYVDAGHVPYFGLGNDTTKEDESNFGYQPTNVTVTETYAPLKWFAVGGGIGYLHVDTGPGDHAGSIQKKYTPETAPGLGTDPEYTVGNVYAAVDWRQSPGYTTSGGYYRIEWTDYNQHGAEDSFSFHRLDVRADQYIPILRANQIIAVRGLASFTYTDEGEQVPFFLMPRLGGSRELRGFPSFRFRDRYRMLLTAEYRWTPSKLMDLALFYEVGKVAPRAGELNFKDLHDSYGFGARFHAPNFTLLRIELARSSENTRFIFDTGLVF